MCVCMYRRHVITQIKKLVKGTSWQIPQDDSYISVDVTSVGLQCSSITFFYHRSVTHFLPWFPTYICVGKIIRVCFWNRKQKQPSGNGFSTNPQVNSVFFVIVRLTNQNVSVRGWCYIIVMFRKHLWSLCSWQIFMNWNSLRQVSVCLHGNYERN